MEDMKDSATSRALASLMARTPQRTIEHGERYVIFSDLHMGGGGRADDLLHNGALLRDLLADWYYPRGDILVLNGDIEELQRFTMARIREQWRSLYELFDRYREAGRFHKILGNHDAVLRLHPHYPYELLDGLRLRAGELDFHLFHGHQSSSRYERDSFLIGLLLRYIATPLGIHNIANRRRLRQRFSIEQAAYTYSRNAGVVSLIGHTHRTLFESLSRYDLVKFEIESLCREYPSADDVQRNDIEKEVHALRGELEKLTKKERRHSLHDSLYGDILPVPCLFNSGNCIGRKGLTCIELDRESISLVYWFTEGHGKKFVSRGQYAIEALPNSPARRVVLNSDRLDYIQARIRLLA